MDDKCSKCGYPLTPCITCGKSAGCGDSWCADCTPDEPTDTEVFEETQSINWALLTELSTKPHPLLNIADDFEAQIQNTPLAWTGEVFHEARTAHHLLDLIGIPRGRGYSSDLDARTYLAIAEIQTLRERLDRLAGWHSRETGPAGTVGSYCADCGNIWPCDSRRIAEGTYVDPEAHE